MMNRKPELDTNTRSTIDAILKESGDRYSAGDLKGSLDAALKAWSLIPDPKNRWDYYPQSLSAGFVQDYTDLNDKANVEKWVAIMAEMYDDPNHEDHLVLMTEGEAMFKLGDMQRAYYIFARIYELYGSKGFAGEQLAYLEFYQKEKVARGE
ncbi:hypothetical protein [Rhizobium sp. FKY42]|uniref:hypothetical protein n=1 Tax=Rhizobium sp. FKY42 TaxID=2562310 RepID=UPI00197F57C1|nr:hypothetical protein [Rhizobium sp. FKY42]